MMVQFQQKSIGASMPKPFDLKQLQEDFAKKKVGATKALEFIGVEYKNLKKAGRATGHLDKAINEILSMDEEIDVDRDTEADAWLNMYSKMDE